MPSGRSLTCSAQTHDLHADYSILGFGGFVKPHPEINEVNHMFEIECLTAEDAQPTETKSCVPDCPCQPDQRENECFPYIVSKQETD